ncbi:uncharacterized protein LOC144133691 [Amblyomma americanum]
MTERRLQGSLSATKPTNPSRGASTTCAEVPGGASQVPHVSSPVECSSTGEAIGVDDKGQASDLHSTARYNCAANQYQNSAPTKASQQPAAPSQPVTCSGAIRQRDPAVFSGHSDQDVEDWLESYKRVSRHNNWDDRVKLTNVIFYLSGVANLWFRNHEADIPTWAVVKSTLSEVFGRPAVRKLRAEQSLRVRAQHTDETFTRYIEDVVDLCKRVDLAMSEVDKIKHIMKGIDGNAFQMLLAKTPTTVASVYTLCQSFDELRKQRLCARRPPPPAEVSGLDINPDLLATIKDFVRDEVARQPSLLSRQHQSPPALSAEIRHAITREVADALPTLRQPASLAPQAPIPPTPVAAPLSYGPPIAVPPAPAPLTPHLSPTFRTTTPGDLS